MVVPDGPVNFPRAVFVLPEMDELAFTDALGFLASRVVETMDIHLDRAIALPVAHLPRDWGGFADRFVTDMKYINRRILRFIWSHHRWQRPGHGEVGAKLQELL